MANDTISVSGPVDIASDSKQAVAYTLMQHIAACEDESAKKKTRAALPPVLQSDDRCVARTNPAG